MDRNTSERQQVYAWGRLQPRAHVIVPAAFADEMVAAIRASDKRPLLCRGLGRSYGDVALNGGGYLLDTARADHFLTADWETGVVRAEAGLSFDALLRVCVPRGWFLPVTPGTKFVTLGGAVANDVHGKNQESAGTIGCHVRRIGLARSTGEMLDLSVDSPLFAATVGGLGLTGVIVWVELKLLPIRSATMDVETLAMARLDDFFRLSAESADWPYTVAWVDSLARGPSLGRGLFMRGRHADAGALTPHGRKQIAVPHVARHLLNRGTIALFNYFYRTRPWATGRGTMHYEPFFYPLDSLSDWNRLYGRRGFFQHQSVVPMKNAPETLRSLLELSAEGGEPSFLTVLKVLGDRPSPGLLSFPKSGVTLALDLANRGDGTRRLLDRMTDVVVAAAGRLYPAKDATMSGEAFRAGYPQWRQLEEQRDPALMSDFWRRVAADAA
ncbi:MAG: FAD-binding oxidoreductase [Hyphomicrobiales bacterium]|nr:FAD-binding oxidoreductase [Hyphomicrobiales bacterium]MBV8826211.1 FAD-binding oxidoreductase [Hyphomicrobiales bacterium]MBV9427623.1 FAD-binding oxidoreductase [Bradyrhizobiaceae bacterium]